MKTIVAADGLRPGGHYALAKEAGGLLFISGLLPTIAGQDHPLASASFEVQLEQVLRHLDAILTEAGIGRDRLAKLSVYLADIALWPACNDVLARYCGDALPARCIVPVPALHYGYLVELEAVAFAGAA
jgi:2-iminobutanoate/2-iminopropanoate deaminase